MLLVIDAGNTNIVFAVHDGKDVRAEWRAVTETTRTADEYAVLLSPLLALNGLTFDDLDSAIIATVVPAALFDLRPCAGAISNASRWWWAIPISISASKFISTGRKRSARTGS